MLGETLEQSFNKLRSIGFRNASFGKDNTPVKDLEEDSGTKSDYIYREKDDQGV